MPTRLSRVLAGTRLSVYGTTLLLDCTVRHWPPKKRGWKVGGEARCHSTSPERVCRLPGGSLSPETKPVSL